MELALQVSATKRGIFIPIFDYVRFETMDTFPSADQVATALIAASKETGADPRGIASGHDVSRETTRARAYAAMAIRAIFDECGAVAIGRMVGAGTPKSYLSTLDFQLRDARIKWWDDKVFMRVIAALEAVAPEQA